jgi:hypothetical protein
MKEKIDQLGEVEGRKQGGEMTQTMYAHVIE